VKLGFLILLAGCSALTSQAGDWTRFRGPNGSGVSEDGALPREIGAGTNVLWKTALPKGKSSPVMTTDRIYLPESRSKPDLAGVSARFPGGRACRIGVIYDMLRVL